MSVDPFTPSRRLLFADYTVLCSEADGTVGDDPEGLYDHDTRILSRHRLTIEGYDLRFVSTGDLGTDRRLTVLIAPRLGGSAAGPLLPQDAIEVRIETVVGPGMVERISLVNRSAVAVTPVLCLELDADFADVMEVGRPRRQEGETRVTNLEHGGIELLYRAERGERRLERGVRITSSEADPPEHRDRATLVWRPELPPNGAWQAQVTFASLVDGEWRTPDFDAVELSPRDHRPEVSRPTIESEPSCLGQIVERAIEDLFALRNRELPGDGDDGWVPNAGVPTYTGLFGRDSLTAGWQAALVGPEISRGALRNPRRAPGDRR